MIEYISPSPLQMHQGKTFVIKNTILDQNDQPYDLTGAAITFVLAKRPGTQALVTKTVSAGIVIDSPLNGLCTITLVPSDTASLRGDYHWEVKAIDQAGRQSTTNYGTLNILRSST